MIFEQIKALIEDHLDLIAYDSNSFKQASERTTKFLIVVSLLAEHRLDLEKRKSKIATMREAFYSHSINEAIGKNITEKKVEAEANVNYTTQREAVESLEAEISYCKTMMNVFECAHVTYRQMSRES